MLGVSGFETSAQFVEAQAPGVFLKTLRNMQVAGSLGRAGRGVGVLVGSLQGFENSPTYTPQNTPTTIQLGVLFFNPLLSLLAISVLPLAEVVSYSETVLERTAHAIGDWLQLSLGVGGWIDLGRFLRIAVSLDAFCVLSGYVCRVGGGIRGERNGRRGWLAGCRRSVCVG